MFLIFPAHDAKQEDGTDDRNISKLSYSTNDLSNMTHNDVNFTQDSKKEPNSTNGKINMNSEINENINDSEDINNPSTVVHNDNNQDISANLHSNTPNSNGKGNYFLIFIFFKLPNKSARKSLLKNN